MPESQTPPAADLGQLRRLLVQHFSPDDLDSLCQDLDVDYDVVPGEGTDAKARELITFMQRRGRLADLVDSAQRERPNAPWPVVSSEETPLAHRADPQRPQPDRPAAAPAGKGPGHGLPASRRVHVDREDEIRRFLNMLEGRQEERILLVAAPSGRGKTWLLLEYQKQAVRAGVPCALIDLRLGGMGVSDTLAVLGEEFGWEHLGRFQRQVTEWERPSADSTPIGRPRIQAALGGADEQARRERLRVLTDALVADLRAWLEPAGRAVVIVDTYNVAGKDQKVEPELREWLEGVFLPHVRRTAGLVVVVAGQQTPEVNTGWEACCDRIELGPLDDPHEWMSYVAAVGATASLEVVAAFCHSCRGEPSAIASMLSSLRNWGGVR